MPELIVTRHAMDRYRERVEDVPDSEIFARLSARVFEIAAEFGARYVRMPQGQRAVIVDHKIVTVLPTDHSPGSLSPYRDYIYDAGGSDA
ncbi:MAG: hypothetical protein CL955_01165 [Erythrobacteraceae bacterium]|nr:hypothetical protein [Erythrobacteraceae bacterium]